MNWLLIDGKLKEWLSEDMNNGDITSEALIEKDSKAGGYFIAKEDGVIAGLDVAGRVFWLLDDKVELVPSIKDGDRVKKGDRFAAITGKTISILEAERVALNILQRLSGIATATARYMERLQGLPVRLVDTRKTTPGMRLLEKYAVCIGGGHNHRFNLSDAVLIKENHITACGGIRNAVEKAKRKVPHTVTVEVEVETIEQMEEAIEAGADIVMLDNMDIDAMRKAVKRNNGRVILEASGNINLDNVREVAETGVDIISSGALTHSVKALDISLRFFR